MHPLAPNLSELKDDELHAKFQELNSKIQQAYRFRNHALLMQLQMLIEDYQNEINNRRKTLLDQKDTKNLSSLIKIK
jgi:uncharacterized protein YsxB (DUF464 family)